MKKLLIVLICLALITAFSSLFVINLVKNRLPNMITETLSKHITVDSIKIALNGQFILEGTPDEAADDSTLVLVLMDSDLFKNVQLEKVKAEIVDCEIMREFAISGYLTPVALFNEKTQASLEVISKNFIREKQQSDKDADMRAKKMDSLLERLLNEYVDVSSSEPEYWKKQWTIIEKDPELENLRWYQRDFLRMIYAKYSGKKCNITGEELERWYDDFYYEKELK
ncbi:hypothetical protein ACFL1E_01005 [Candidatus Omnitrophota bacterium]